VAAGTTRITIYNHFTNSDNLADLVNKYNNQNNMCFLLGNLLGIAYSLLVPSSFTNVIMTLSVLSVLQMYVVHKSVFKIVNLTDFNKQRAYYLAEEYLRSNHILDLVTLNKKEKLLFQKANDIKFSSYPLDRLLSVEKDNRYVLELLDVFKDSKFFVYVRGKTIYVYIHIDAEQIDIFIALLYAIRLRDQYLNKNFHDKEELIKSIRDNLDFVNKINKQELVAAIEAKKFHIKFDKVEEQYLRYHIV
jgi:hypothetical protein